MFIKLIENYVIEIGMKKWGVRSYKLRIEN